MTCAEPLADTRLKRRSRVAALVCLVMAFLLPASVAAVLAYAGPGALVSGSPSGFDPTRLALFLAGLAGFAPALLAGAALLSARACLEVFAAGRWFEPDAAAALRRMAARMIAAAAAALVAPTAIWLILSAGAPEGERMLVVEIGSGPLLGVVLGAAVWLISDVMARAAELAADHAEIV